ncbi:hypothetical protein N9X40_03350 [bacterium]|nr:hypothetical protein [bacterium]
MHGEAFLEDYQRDDGYRNWLIQEGEVHSKSKFNPLKRYLDCMMSGADFCTPWVDRSKWNIPSSINEKDLANEAFVGFKLMLGTVRKEPNILKSSFFIDARKIFFLRREWKDAVISELYARRAGNFHYTEAAELREVRLPLLQVSLLCLKEGMYNRMIRRIRNSVTDHTIYYEEFVESSHSCLEKLSRSLGVTNEFNLDQGIVKVTNSGEGYPVSNSRSVNRVMKFYETFNCHSST